MDEPRVTSVASADKPPAAAAAPRTRARDGTDPDVDLIAACRRGDPRALELLYHRYKRRVFGLVTRIAGPGDAEEVAQEVFVRIYRGLAKFRGDSALSTWIYRLSVNAALSHVTRRPRPHEPDDALAAVAAPAAPASDPYLRARVERCLQQLPAGYRAVLVLHDVEGLSHEECAEILGCRVGTSKSQLHKARAKMRELLGPDVARQRGGRNR
ncbi:MAG: sigma-70 family RNA polymerase sigma factor [Deltaproteobacteria bacterium]|nr:MAG: sigma-70 family RNA polymerase sigma factor [Deltaproteobacteria bacterium]